jgi:hypothetical protein
MRKPLLFLLLASSAVPAFAAQDNNDDRAARREAARAERAEARSERQAEKSQPAPRSEPQIQARSVEPVVQGRGPVIEPRHGVADQRALVRRSDPNIRAEAPRPTLEQHRDAADSVREWRARERLSGNGPAAIEQRNTARDEWRARERTVGNGPGTIEPRNAPARDALREQRRQQRIESRDSIGNRRAPIVSRVPREGTQPPPPVAAKPSSQSSSHWNHNWRSNNHYDWQNYRRRHRSLFHLGFYYDPFGWGYRPYSIGWRLWPSYYRSSYWLHDPWSYRLPYAPPGYRWIRYFDDAILVDTWDGEVVDVIYDFFW